MKYLGRFPISPSLKSLAFHWPLLTLNSEEARVISLFALSASFYLALCKELPVSLKTPRGFLPSGEGDRSACGGLHADPKGQGGKGSGGHLLGAP